MKSHSIEKLIDVKNLCQIASNGKLSKFSYGCKRVLENLTPLVKKEYDDLMYEKRISLAVTGEKGEILTDDKDNPKLTPENLIKLNAYSKELMKKVVEADLYQISDIDLIKEDLFALEVLNGVVIDVNIEDLIK